MTPRRLRMLLFAALAGTLALAWFGGREDGDAEPAAGAATSRKGGAARAGRLPAAAQPAGPDVSPGTARLARAARTPPPERVPDLFRSFSWYVPPPPATAPPPVAKPSAPPLPFAFIGQYTEDDRALLILTRGDRVLTVSLGEVIDGTWRMESMSGGLLTFVYLPLDLKQTLNTGTIQ